jgi:hypothetical protein
MTADTLIERLRNLPPSQWSPGVSGNRAALDALEREYNLRLPEDYRRLMETWDGGALRGPRTVVNLESAETLMGHNHDEIFEQNIPAMFVIGDDGGGSIYFYDPANQFGRGAYALFLVPLGSLLPEDTIFAGRNLAETIDRVLAGESFFEGPRV